MDVHHRAHLALLVRVLVVHRAHHLVAQVVRLAHQGLVHQDIVRAVRQVRVVLVRAHHQVLEAQAIHHQVQVLVVQEAIVAHEALVALRQ